MSRNEFIGSGHLEGFLEFRERVKKELLKRGEELYMGRWEG